MPTLVSSPSSFTSAPVRVVPFSSPPSRVHPSRVPTCARGHRDGQSHSRAPWTLPDESRSMNISPVHLDDTCTGSSRHRAVMEHPTLGASALHRHSSSMLRCPYRATQRVLASCARWDWYSRSRAVVPCSLSSSRSARGWGVPAGAASRRDPSVASSYPI